MVKITNNIIGCMGSDVSDQGDIRRGSGRGLNVSNL